MNKGTSQKKLCSELVVDFLSEQGLTHVFDLAGGMITYLEDAISQKKGIECVPMHHEQAAGFAAEGYARKGRRFGVAIATSGPGATNLITAIGSSYFDSIPTLFITGQVHTNNLKKKEGVRQEGFQETDIVNTVKHLTKYAVLVLDPRMVLYELEKAYYIMKTGRNGSVLVDIPINLQRAQIEVKEVKHFFDSQEHRQMEAQTKKKQTKIPVGKVKQLQQLLKESKAPLVVVGNGVRLSDTTKLLDQFTKRNNTPVATSLLGIDAYQDRTLNVGYIGTNGNRDANIIFANADLIIALGTRLDLRQTGDPTFFNKSAKLVHVDIDESAIDYALQSELSFNTDLNIFFQAVKNIATERKSSWFNFIKKVKEEFARNLPYVSEINPNTFFYELSKITPKNSTIVVDVGQNQMWCAQSWNIKNGQRLLFSGGMGAMGFALPAAIGAWHADKKNNIIAINGDGGIQINIQELETVSRNKIPMKIFVMNNKSLGMVREFQDLYFNQNYQSTVKGYGFPDFKKLADAYNLGYVCISKLSQDDQQLVDIIASPQPLLIEVDIDIRAPLQPKVVYGHALDDQAPYLNETQKAYLEKLKSDLKSL